MCFSLQGNALGSSGENCLWNFKDLKEGNAFTIEYQIVPTTIDTTWLYDNIRQLSANENYTYCNDILVHTKQNSLVYYLQKPNKQLLVGIENNLIKLDFDKPITLLHLPITYKEKSSDTFNGTLSYSENLFFEVYGTSTTEVDGRGTIMLPNGETIDSVTRIHNTILLSTKLLPSIHNDKSLQLYKNEKYRLNADSIINICTAESDTLKIDIYKWYAEGYRYPVFETLVSKNGNTGNINASSSYTPTNEQAALYDPDNEQQRTIIYKMNDTLYTESNDNIDKDVDLIKNITVNGSLISVECTTKTTTEATSLVSDETGIIYLKSTHHIRSNGNSILKVDCSSLHRGKYVLHIIANNTSCSRTFTLK